MGNETVCNLWQERRCFCTVCKYRHMAFTKNRKDIPCYWENQPAGCQKPHCAFFHKKPRYINGIFYSANKQVGQTKRRRQEEQNPSSKKFKQEGEIRVKTLEEIRREKAVRMQALEAENKKSSETEENGTKKPCLLRINKLASQSNFTTKKSPEGIENPVKRHIAVSEVFQSSAKAEWSPALPHTPSTLLDSVSSSIPLKEELQMFTAASISAVDDFDELISEFTDEHLEVDMDPDIGEDELLQELSEMIDS